MEVYTKEAERKCSVFVDREEFLSPDRYSAAAILCCSFEYTLTILVFLLCSACMTAWVPSTMSSVTFCTDKIAVPKSRKGKKNSLVKAKKRKKGNEALTGFEPVISCLLDRRFNQLSHRARTWRSS